MKTQLTALAAALIMLSVGANASDVSQTAKATLTSTLVEDGRTCETELTWDRFEDVGISIMEVFETLRAKCNEDLDIDVNVGSGVSISKCVPGAFLCAMAMADTHEEKINNAPNMGFAGTGGHAQSNWAMGGDADIETDLGDAEVEFEAWSGAGASWTDISDDCKWKELRATTTASSPPWYIAAAAYDGVCESR